MSMKRLSAIFLVVCLMLSLVGCGTPSATDKDSETPQTKVGKELADGMSATLENVNKTAAAALKTKVSLKEGRENREFAATEKAIGIEEALFNLVKETGSADTEMDFRMRTVNVLDSINEQLSVIIGLAYDIVKIKGPSFDFKNQVLTMDMITEPDSLRATVDYIDDYYIVQAYQAQGGEYESALNMKIKYNGITDYEMCLEQASRSGDATQIVTMYLGPKFAVDASATVTGQYLTITGDTEVTDYYNSSVRFDTQEHYFQPHDVDNPFVQYGKRYLELLGFTGQMFDDIKAELTAATISLNICSMEDVRAKSSEVTDAWETVRADIVDGLEQPLAY